MIVKNEAAGIYETLNSCVGLVDRFDILDTGSTDNTRDLIWEWSARSGVPGTIHQGPFQDFSQARNLALDLCQADWALLLSGDELVLTCEGLRGFLRDSECQEHDAAIRLAPWAYGHIRLVRPQTCGRYVMPTHETLIPVDQGKAAPITIRSGRPGEDRRPRWELDRQLLEADLDRGDPRTVFYLAQTYECLGDLDRAADLYEARARVPGYEQWQAMLRAGRLGRDLWLFRAIGARPYRAEAWLALAQWHRKHGHLKEGLACARRAAALPIPSDRDFVDLSAYQGGAWAELVTLQNLVLGHGMLGGCQDERSAHQI